MVLGIVADILFHQLTLFFNWYGDLGLLYRVDNGCSEPE